MGVKASQIFSNNNSNLRVMAGNNNGKKTGAKTAAEPASKKTKPAAETSKSKAKEPKEVTATASKISDASDDNEELSDEDPVESSVQLMVRAARMREASSPKAAATTAATHGTASDLTNSRRSASRSASQSASTTGSDSSGCIVNLAASTTLADLSVDPDFDVKLSQMPSFGNGQHMKARIPTLVFAIEQGFKHSMSDVQTLILKVLHHVIAVKGFVRNPKKEAMEMATQSGAILAGKALLTSTISNAIGVSSFYTDYLSRRVENMKHLVFSQFTEDMNTKSCWNYLTGDLLDSLKVLNYYLILLV
jgi:hypothetical protein